MESPNRLIDTKEEHLILGADGAPAPQSAGEFGCSASSLSLAGIASA